MHIGFCYPTGWGFADPSQAGPTSQLTGDQQSQLNLYSQEAFPWDPSNEDQFDNIAKRNSAKVQFIVAVPPLPGFAPECTPSTPITVSGLAAKWCEDTFDLGGAGKSSDEVTFTSQGAFHNLKLLIPLRSTPTAQPGDPDLSGAQLLVSVLTKTGRYKLQASMLWQFVQTLRIY